MRKMICVLVVAFGCKARTATISNAKNAFVFDPVQSARDQGLIASCASFGFIGLVENNLFQKTGVSVDLSERYQLLLNFQRFGSPGGEPTEAAQFHDLADESGMLPEEMYPYSYLMPRAAQFGSDPNVPSPAEKAVAKLSNTQRREVLESEDFLGPLPRNNGILKVSLPVRALNIKDQDRVPWIRSQSRNTPCFYMNSPPPDVKFIEVTPQEFAKSCVLLDRSKYATCLGGASRVNADNFCATDDSQQAFAQEWSAFHAPIVQALMTQLDSGNASFVGVQTPFQSDQLWGNIWSNSASPRVQSSHAILLVGYISAEKLKLPAQHSQGLLATEIFDRFAGAMEPRYSVNLQLPPEARYESRIKSKLAALIEKEGGVFLFRNSRTPNLGYFGHQLMTFEYLMINFGTSIMINASLISGCAGETPLEDPWLKTQDRMELHVKRICKKKS